MSNPFGYGSIYTPQFQQKGGESGGMSQSSMGGLPGLQNANSGGGSGGGGASLFMNPDQATPTGFLPNQSVNSHATPQVSGDFSKFNIDPKYLQAYNFDLPGVAETFRNQTNIFEGDNVEVRTRNGGKIGFMGINPKAFDMNNIDVSKMDFNQAQREFEGYLSALNAYKSQYADKNREMIESRRFLGTPHQAEYSGSMGDKLGLGTGMPLMPKEDKYNAVVGQPGYHNAQVDNLLGMVDVDKMIADAQQNYIKMFNKYRDSGAFGAL